MELPTRYAKQDATSWTSNLRAMRTTACCFRCVCLFTIEVATTFAMHAWCRGMQRAGMSATKQSRNHHMQEKAPLRGEKGYANRGDLLGVLMARRVELDVPLFSALESRGGRKERRKQQMIRSNSETGTREAITRLRNDTPLQPWSTRPEGACGQSAGADQADARRELHP